jgi:hypothetical protein
MTCGLTLYSIQSALKVRTAHPTWLNYKRIYKGVHFKQTSRNYDDMRADPNVVKLREQSLLPPGEG